MTSVIRREGKLERENLQFAVENHFMRLPDLAPHTTSLAPTASDDSESDLRLPDRRHPEATLLGEIPDEDFDASSILFRYAQHLDPTSMSC